MNPREEKGSTSGSLNNDATNTFNSDKKEQSQPLLPKNPRRFFVRFLGQNDQEVMQTKIKNIETAAIEPLQSELEKLPVEVLAYILGFLSLKDISSAAATCTHLQTIALFLPNKLPIPKNLQIEIEESRKGKETKATYAQINKALRPRLERHYRSKQKLAQLKEKEVKSHTGWRNVSVGDMLPMPPIEDMTTSKKLCGYRALFCTASAFTGAITCASAATGTYFAGVQAGTIVSAALASGVGGFLLPGIGFFVCTVVKTVAGDWRENEINRLKVEIEAFDDKKSPSVVKMKR